VENYLKGSQPGERGQRYFLFRYGRISALVLVQMIAFHDGHRRLRVFEENSDEKSGVKREPSATLPKAL
jgi:hypothetical protein